MSLNTLSQFGLPAIVRVFRPVIRSLLDCNGFMDWGILDMSWHDLRRYDKDWHDLLIPDIRTDMIWEEVIWNLLVQELERKLKPNCLHVGLLQGGGDVHVHVEEPAFQIGDICFDKDILLVSYFHCPSSLPLSLLSLSSLLSSFSPFHRPSLFRLLNLQLREQRDKPEDKILLNLNDFDFGHPLDLIFRGKAHHSKLRCSLLIQKKSTFRKFITFVWKPFQTIFKRWQNSPLRLSPNRWQRRDTNVSRGW